MKFHFAKTILGAAVISIIQALPLAACDSCAVPMPVIEIPSGKTAGFYFSLEEQFSHYGTVRVDGTDVGNPTGQYMNSSITHVVIGTLLFDNRLAFQVNLPFIGRRYLRPEGFEIERGTVSGLGDLSLVASWNIFRTKGIDDSFGGGQGKNAKAVMLPAEPDFFATVNVLAGLKFPTGSSSRIKEEFHEVEVEGAPESGIHGHDLALGSGSWDGVFGVEAFVRRKNWFFQAEMQYTARSEGDFSYRYANEITWSGGPGVYLMREPGRSVALQAVISGSSKGTDTFQGESAEDTGLTMLYVGPRLLGSFGSWTMDFACDLPVVTHNTALQVTPDFRIRAGVSYHF